MKLNPSKNYSLPAYPSKKEYSTRYKRIFSLIAAAGMGSSLMGTQAIAAEKTGTEKKVKAGTETKKPSMEEVRKTVILLASRLGNENYKVRQDATRKLIDIGKIEISDKTDKKNKPAKEKKKEEITPKKIVLEEMKKHTKNKDPEISQRAKSVIAALAVVSGKKVPKPPRPRLGGIIAVDGDIAIEPEN